MKRVRHGFTIVELLTVLSIVVLLLTLFAPSLQTSRDAARRIQCKNNLKQLGLALHNYEEVYRSFPPGWTNHGSHPGLQVRFGWSTSILPFVDQGPLWNQLDTNSHTIDDREHVNLMVATYRCPSDTTEKTNKLRGGFGTSNYSGNFGHLPAPRWTTGGMNPLWPGEVDTPLVTSGFFSCNSRVRITDARDGLSNTFLVGERSISSGSGIWMGVRGNNFESDQVTECSPGNELNSGLDSFSSQHDGGANFLLADGTVRFINNDIDSGTFERPGLYQNLSSRSDGNSLSNF